MAWGGGLLEKLFTDTQVSMVTIYTTLCVSLGHQKALKKANSPSDNLRK